MFEDYHENAFEKNCRKIVEVNNKEDYCRTINLIIHNGKVGEVYNVVGHNEMENIDIVKLICKHIGKPEGLITYVTDCKCHHMVTLSTKQKFIISSVGVQKPSL